MALKQKEAANYVKIKDGRFYLTTDKENTTPYDELEGVLTNIGLRMDNYEGSDIEKLQLTLTDGQENYILGFAFDSSYTSSLIGFLKNADLSRPLTLIPVSKTEGEKVRRSLLVKQNGSFLKGYYTKDNPNGLPRIQKMLNSKGQPIKQNGREMWDKEEFNEFLRNVVTNELAPQLGGGIHGEAVSRTPMAVDNNHINSGDEVVDDLPF